MYIFKFVYTFASLLFILHNKYVKGVDKFSIVRKTEILFSNKDTLQNLTVPHIDFDTGEQEFGCFKGYFENVKIDGLDAYKVNELRISTKQVLANVSVPQLNFTGDYKLDGMLNFPMGNKPIHVFGKGDMKTVIGNLAVSTKITLKTKGAKIMVKELLVSVNISAMNVKLCNLMGGGALENIFNDYLNLLGLTVFDHYKNDVIEQMKEPVILEINKFLDEFFSCREYEAAENCPDFTINKKSLLCLLSKLASSARYDYITDYVQP